MSKDQLQRFVFEGLPVRGEMVFLNASWRAVLDRHAYPEPIQALLAEFLVATTLLSATLKFEGSLIVQLHGDGPVSLVVVESSSERTIRGLARWHGDVTSGSLQSLVGNGKLTITIDPRNGMQRYQSIVLMEGNTIAQILENYLAQSEQIQTRLWIASNEQQAVGLLLQRLPSSPSQDEFWNHVIHLSETITSRELLGLPAEKILYRLYHEETVRLFDPEPVMFRCSCSRERVGNMLRALGEAEVLDIIAEQSKIRVHCEFCNQAFEFDNVDAGLLFADETPPETPNVQH